MFNNIDSTIDFKLSPRYIDKFYALAGILNNSLSKVKIYLVNENTMDKIYPPEKRLTLDEECLRELLSTREFYDYDYEIIERCQREKYKLFQAVGVYVRGGLSFDLGDVRFPSIFICPERCINWGKKLNISPQFVFIKVLFHELSHAYLDVPRLRATDYYKTWWGKIIEESLANTITLSRFKSHTDIANAVRLINNQPIEYRGCYLLVEKYKNREYLWDLFVAYFYFLWRKGRIPDPIDFEDFIRFLMRRFPELYYFKPYYWVTIQSLYSLLLNLWKEYKHKPDDKLEILLKKTAVSILESIV